MKRTVLITGCSSGIGLCVAEGLQKRGYRVFATARKMTDVETLQEKGLESLPLDLTDSVSIQVAVNEVLKRTGGELYALFNNGAYAQSGAVEDLSREALRAQFETNLFGWQELTNLIIPVMRSQRYGRIIQNSSILGMMPLSYRGAYVASKFALEGLSSCMRLELVGTGVYVSLIEPGPIVSRIRQNAMMAFQQYIDVENSAHKQRYLKVQERLKKEGSAMRFTLPPDAVLKRVIHALESPKPKIRYYVTIPTYFAGFLRRVLSYRMVDRALIASSGGGKR